MRVVIFTALFMGFACLALGYGLAGVTLQLRRQQSTEVHANDPASARYLNEVLPEILPELSERDAAGIPLRQRLGAYKRLYRKQPGVALDRLGRILEDPAAEALQRLYEREARPAWRRRILRTLGRQGLDSGKDYLRRIASGPQPEDRAFARSLLGESAAAAKEGTGGDGGTRSEKAEGAR